MTFEELLPLAVSQNEQLCEMRELLRVRDEEYAILTSKYLLLQRQVYGCRSERRLPDPEVDMAGWLFTSDLEVEVLDAEKEVEPIREELEKRSKEAKEAKAKSKKEKRGQRTLKIDPNIPVEEIVHEPEGFDPEKHEKIGERVRDILQMRPHEFYIERHISPVYKTKGSTYLDNPEILRASVDTGNASGTKIGNTIFAQMMVDKFAHHIPEYRQLKRLKEMGV